MDWNAMTGGVQDWEEEFFGQEMDEEPMRVIRRSHHTAVPQKKKKPVTLAIKRPTLLGENVLENGHIKKGEVLYSVLSSELA